MTTSTSPHPDLATIVQSAAPGPGSKRRVVLIGLAIVVVAVAAYLWFGGRRDSAQSLSFATQPLSRGNISLAITATGNLEPTNEITVGSELSGLVLEVYVDTNDHVTVGQPLAKLDTTKLAQQIASSRANLQVAQASVAQAEATELETANTLARLEDLRVRSNGQLPSRTEFDAATAAHDRASANLLSSRANVAQAEASLRINENDLSKAVIKSPIEGIVLARDVEPGQTVAASFTAPELFVIAENLEHMKLMVTVAEADIGRLRAGQPARFTVDAWPGRTYEAAVIKVAYGSSVTNNVVTYETELQVTNADLSLRPGMTATADIDVATSRSVFLVPSAALRFEPPTPAAAGGTVAAAPESTFLQSLSPMPRRRPSSGAPGVANSAPAGKRIWILRDGQPVSIDVTVGLDDGRQVEVSAPELSEGLPVILRTTTTASR